MNERCPQLKHGKNTGQEIMMMFPDFQGRPLSTLADVCRAYATKHHDKLAPATIKNRIRYLTAACRYAWKHHSMGEADPAARVVEPAVRNERNQVIDSKAMLMLARKCKNQAVRAAIRIAFYSGMRQGEIAVAERIEGVFVLRDTKNG